jgi:alpha-L-rhamnosidase
MKKLLISATIVLTLFSCNTVKNNKNTITPENLTCETESHATGIDNLQPVFGWQLASTENNVMQIAYQVIVASSEDLLTPEKADMWNSKKVNSSQSQYVTYSGKPLESASRYFFAVQTFDSIGNESGFSKPNYFETGILKDTDWKANWIQAPKPLNKAVSVIFRNSISISKKIQRAQAFASATGAYNLFINGKRAGNQQLAPDWTDFSKCIQYQSIDVTDLLQNGENAIGSIAGKFWNKDEDYPLQFFMQLKVEYTDGTNEWFITNNAWKCHPSPITECGFGLGETYNSKLEVSGWNNIGFHDAGWELTNISPSKHKLVSQQVQPVVAKGEIKAKNIYKSDEGAYILDMGETLSGWVKINATVSKGATIKLKYLSTYNFKDKKIGKIVATDKYITATTTIDWEPEFAYHTFRFVEVTGLNASPDSNTVIAKVAYPDVANTGNFECSNNLINTIYMNMVRTGRNNMVSILTGMPDASLNIGSPVSVQAYANMALYTFDLRKGFVKYMNDLKLAQKNDGRINFNTSETGSNSAGWPDVIVQLPWKTYIATGDKRILTNNYESIKAWHNSRERESDAMAPPYMYNKEGNGDIYSLENTSTTQIGSTYYYYSSTTLSQIAAAIGNTDDETVYMELAGFTKDQFNQSFLTYRKARYWAETQTAHVLPMAVGLTPLSYNQRIADFIAKDIKKNDTHLTTGALATQFVLPLLSQNNYHELAYKLMAQTSKPSWGYMTEKGSSTIWGSWDGVEESAPYQLALASAGEWLYSNLVGIRPDSKFPGYKHSIIDPNPAGDLKWAKASLQTAYGLLSAKWEKQNNKLIVDVTIPTNTWSTLTLPVANTKTARIELNGEEIIMNGKATENCPKYIKFKGFDSNMTVIEVGSGTYTFAVE